jgi:hypothetical protein
MTSVSPIHLSLGAALPTAGALPLGDEYASHRSMSQWIDFSLMRSGNLHGIDMIARNIQQRSRQESKQPAQTSNSFLPGTTTPSPPPSLSRPCPYLAPSPLRDGYVHSSQYPRLTLCYVVSPTKAPQRGFLTKGKFARTKQHLSLASTMDTIEDGIDHLRWRLRKAKTVHAAAHEQNSRHVLKSDRVWSREAEVMRRTT